MGCCDEGLRDAPNVFFRRYPVQAVKAAQVHRSRVGTQSALAAQVVVVLKVAEGQFAQGAVDGRAEAEAGEV